MPIGEYLLSDTLQLRPRNNLIGLNPRQTWLKLIDEAPAFADPEHPRAIVETPPGGKNIVAGLGLDTNRWNPGSAQVHWQSGPHSMLSDVTTQFVKWSPAHTEPGNPGTGDPGYAYRGASKYNFWVDGGGGSFINLWSAYGWSENGFFAENTDVPATLYQVSVEHHRYREVVLRNVKGWELHALQTEDHIYGWESQAVEIVDSDDLLLANTVFFRVATVLGPHPYAIGVQNSTDIRVRGTRGYRDVNVDNTRWGATIRDVASGREIPELEVAYLTLSSGSDRSSGYATVAPRQSLFGTLPGGSTKTSMTVTNHTPAPLRRSDLVIDADKDMTVDAEVPAVIAAGATVEVPVTISVAADAEMETYLSALLHYTATAGGASYEMPLRIGVRVGGLNLALGSRVAATSVHSRNVAEHAVDGATTGSRWISSLSDPRPGLTIDLSYPAELHRMVLHSGVTGSSSLRVVAVNVEGLIEGSWVGIGSLAENDESPVTIPLDAPGPVSQVRLTFAQGSRADAVARVFEVQIYGIR